MSSFLCYVSGRIDPIMFFYNLQLCFESPPDLFTLRRAIEQRVWDEEIIPGNDTRSTQYRVCDIDILDFRSRTWVCLDSRASLYSGCFLTAIRDATTGSSSTGGFVDVPRRDPLKKVLTFAINAHQMFETLDLQSEETLTLRNFLKVFSHDIKYAVEAFGVLDPEAEGRVTKQKFLLAFQKQDDYGFFEELKRRISSGGKALDEDDDDPENRGRGSLTRIHAINEEANTVSSSPSPRGVSGPLPSPQAFNNYNAMSSTTPARLAAPHHPALTTTIAGPQQQQQRSATAKPPTTTAISSPFTAALQTTTNQHGQPTTDVVVRTDPNDLKNQERVAKIVMALRGKSSGGSSSAAAHSPPSTKGGSGVVLHTPSSSSPTVGISENVLSKLRGRLQTKKGSS